MIGVVNKTVSHLSVTVKLRKKDFILLLFVYGTQYKKK